MFTLVQDGLAPLAMGHMWSLETTITVFLDESEPGPINVQDLNDSLLDADTDWSDFPRAPTRLEIMAACCAMERRGDLQFEFVEGQLCVTRVTSPR